MGEFEGKPDSTETEVLTTKEAAALIVACHDYLRSPEDHVDNRHRSEVVAKAMEQDGQFDLASDVLAIHNVLKAFGNGKFEEASYFEAMPVGENLLNAAKGTKFVKAVESLAKQVEQLDEILGDRRIDWEKSSEVLAKVKRERYPETLSMVEKLTNFQHDQTRGRTA